MVGHSRPGTAVVPAIAALVAVAVMLSGIGNGFAYDDIPIIVENTALHSPAELPLRLIQPYWPAALYRPVTLAAFGLQWIAGGGGPLLFHLVSLCLYAALAVQVVLLGRRMGAPPFAALLAGVVFAVHPVHSEVTANVVGQAELLSGLLVVAAILTYLRARERGGPNWGETTAILAFSLLASLAKESGYVVVGLLVAAELLVVPFLGSAGPDRSRLRVPALVLLATMLAAILVRIAILGGIGGEAPHQSWLGMSAAHRAVAMLGVVPEWARLLVFPLHLQADYGPPALAPEAAPGLAHLLGALLVLAVLGGLVWARRRDPLLAFGLAWVALALAPVANIAFPTGIILAERTLFLPSIGVSLVIAGAAARLAPRLSARATGALGAATAALLLAAAVWSGLRQPAWRDSRTILTRTVQDAPRTYRAHMVLGKELLHEGDREAAKRSFALAGELWAHDPGPFEELGQLLRAEGACDEAIVVLRRGIAADSTSDIARSRLVECLIVEQRWDEAAVEVGRGLGQGVSAYRGALGRIEAGRREPIAAGPATAPMIRARRNP